MLIHKIITYRARKSLIINSIDSVIFSLSSKCAVERKNLFDRIGILSCSISTQSTMKTIKLSDYGCIGFDLDNTLLQYKITNLVKLEYHLLVKYLIEEKKYSPKYLQKPLTEADFDFMQKGLLLDLDRGNVLKLDANGKIWRAAHGTRLLTPEELNAVYPGQSWEVTSKFANDMFSTWNGEFSLKTRSLMDYFDVPAALVFAKAVDTVDEENGKSLNLYKIWPDILDGAIYIYDRMQFKNNGDFFGALKSNPEKYMHTCSPQTIAWIQQLKKKQKTCLITGSHADFVNFTASYALGKNWRSLFDIVICYAKKPGFFVNERPFLNLEDFEEKDVVAGKDLQEGGIYSQGNWKELMEFVARITGQNDPRCLYFGDNLIQDIYVPTIAKCDTMVVVDEQLAEKMLHHDLSHCDESIINSNFWGSYFSLKEADGYKDSFCNHIIKTYSKVCIPKVDIIATLSLDQPIECFCENDVTSSGYYPAKPLSLHL